jgi:ATP phosphoribosyltransferase
MENIKIGIQKSGRLHDQSIDILKRCGISIDNGKDQLKAKSPNFPLEIYYLRNGDIPQYLKDGVVDAAIIGENLLIEKSPDITYKMKLGFSKCRVCLAIPKNKAYKGIQDFDGQKIATSYPNTVNEFLKKHQISADIHIINGSVEIAPNIGLADGICDIVSTGSTLFKNNLKEVETILSSEAVLATSPHMSDEVHSILERLSFRLNAVLKAKNSKYILMNVPNEKIDHVIQLLPGMKSPTVMPLVEKNWSSVHTVIEENDFWNVIDQLKQAGAEGILVAPIEKMIL